MDALALALFLLLLAAVLAYGSRSAAAWMREKWERVWDDTWAPESPAGSAGTMEDPHVAAMVDRQRRAGHRLRMQGRSLLANKPYSPVTQPVLRIATKVQKTGEKVLHLHRPNR